MSTMLKFATFTSDIELSFYASLASHKINDDKLDDSPRRVTGLYELQTGRVALHGKSLTSDDVPSNAYRAEGAIKNYNTIEEYRTSDKGLLLERAGRTVWEAIADGTIFSCPSLLASFTIICFSDLKKYKFTYLFGYPALHAEKSWHITTHTSDSSSDSADKQVAEGHSRLSGTESTSLVEAVATWRYAVDSRQWGFFLAKRTTQVESEAAVDLSSSPLAERNRPLVSNWQIGSLSEYEQGFFNGTKDLDRFICFADPSSHTDYPGWPLRNLLMLVHKRWGLSSLQVLCYRDVHVRRHEARSLILTLQYQNSNEEATDAMPKVTGWERGPSGKVVSKIANLGEYMDPTKLADQAVDLNLKLIKWRIAPSLDLDVVKDTKCLLLGAGTLGSYVSRNLLGWGVKTVTFVDNGNVSFSNPVRQPLYNFEDCLGGGVPKAERAASALREIYPGVKAAGYKMSVPMAGHPIIDESKTREEYQTLARLFHEHDVIFLLMDSRESRWLPTVMGKAMGKLVLNAALGFDTYLVMRHGLPDPQNSALELGCYFCNDVVAPMDSMSDRTLDQQCTVTRPGVAAIASALAVELMVSVLQENKAGAVSDSEATQHPLGSVPHTIRGFLSSWSNMNITGKSYDQCSACSSKIIEGYRNEEWKFVEQALNDATFVTELSGLAEVQRKAEEAAAGLEWDEDEGDSGALEEEDPLTQVGEREGVKGPGKEYCSFGQNLVTTNFNCQNASLTGWRHRIDKSQDQLLQFYFISPLKLPQTSAISQNRSRMPRIAVSGADAVRPCS